jgi:hypothetical protein
MWNATNSGSFSVAYDDDVEAGAQPLSLPLQPVNMSQSAAAANTKKPVKFALLKGRVPVKVSH